MDRWTRVLNACVLRCVLECVCACVCARVSVCYMSACMYGCAFLMRVFKMCVPVCACMSA